MKAFNAAGLLFPWRHLTGPRKGEIDWKPLAHHIVLRILHNPRYAGASPTAGHATTTRPAGRRPRRLLPREEWISFIPGAHPGYITLDQYDANLATLAANAAAHGHDRAADRPAKEPRCCRASSSAARCGLRMTIRYHHRAATRNVPTYICQRDGIENGTASLRRDPRPQHSTTRSARLLIDTLTPLAVEAALQVSAELEHRAAEADALRAAHVERAQLPRRPGPPPLPGRRPRQPARRRHPRSRLEHRPPRAERRPGRLRQGPPAARRPAHRRPETRIQQLVTDLPAIWNDPATPQRERKRIARLLLTDVTVTQTGDLITAHVRLAGGQDHTLTVPAPLPVADQRRTPAEVITAIDDLLDQHTSRRDRRHPQPARPGQRHRRTLPPPHHRRTSSAPTGYAAAASASATPACSPSPKSPPPTASTTTPSRPGAEPELSPAPAITTKESSSTTRPTPATRPDRPEDRPPPRR